MHRPAPAHPGHASTAPHFPTSIAQAKGAARDLTPSEAEVGDLRHDLHERHEWWLIEQYLEGSN